MSRFAEKMHVSPVRRFMLNAFSNLTGDPSVGGGCEVDATELIKFVERVSALAADPAAREAMQLAARAWVEKHRGWDRLVDGYRYIYERAGKGTRS